MNANYDGTSLQSPPPTKWAAGTAFIWYPDNRAYYEIPNAAYCLFRRRFVAPVEFKSATLRLFADTHYALWANGQYVCRGPCRADPRYAYFDVIDIGPYLKPGAENVIAVLVGFYGHDTGRSISRFPLLMGELEIDGAVALKTDASWRCRIEQAFDTNAQRMNGCQGPIEVFDNRVAVPGWRDANFDEADWPAPKTRPVLKFNHPFWNLQPRPIRMLREEVVVASGTVRGTIIREHPQPIDRLHVQLMTEQAQAWDDEPLAAADEIVIAPTAVGRAAVRTFDFGRVEVGYAQLDVTGPAGTVVDVAYAETLIAGKVPAHQVSNRPFARFVLAEGRNALEAAFAWRACRFIRLTVRNPAGEVVVHRVALRTRRYPLERVGAVITGDAQADRIWEISARTLEICAQDAYVDSPSREQQQWMGDGRWQAVFDYALSGDSRLHRKLLDQIGQGQDCHGLTRSRFPDGHENYQPIPSFTLAWVSSFADYWLYTSDLSPAQKWWPNILLALRWFDSFVGRSGLLVDVPHWNFVDWSMPQSGPWVDERSGVANVALNLQYLEALRCAIRMGEALGQDVQPLMTRAAVLQAALRSIAWDEQAGVHPMAIRSSDGAPDEHSPVMYEAVNALALLHLYDVGDDRAQRIVDAILHPAAASRSVRPVSPYFMLTLCRGLAKHGHAGRAMDIVRERYGRLLNAGATSLWERWELSHGEPQGLDLDVTSASHAWGAAPLTFYGEALLGIRPIEPGFTRFSFMPNLLDLPELNGRVPTPHGVIAVEVWREPDGATSASLLVPPKCTAVLADGAELPAGAHMLRVTANLPKHRPMTANVAS